MDISSAVLVVGIIDPLAYFVQWLDVSGEKGGNVVTGVHVVAGIVGVVDAPHAGVPHTDVVPVLTGELELDGLSVQG